LHSVVHLYGNYLRTQLSLCVEAFKVAHSRRQARGRRSASEPWVREQFLCKTKSAAPSDLHSVYSETRIRGAPADGLMGEFRLSIVSTSSLAFGLMCCHSRSGKSTYDGVAQLAQNRDSVEASERHTLDFLTRRKISCALLPQKGA